MVLLWCAAAGPAPGVDGPETAVPSDPVRAALSRIVLPSVEFHEDEIGRIVETFNTWIHEADPDGARINILLMPPRRGDLGQGALPPSHPISLSLKNVSLYDTIRTLCEVASLQLRIEGRVVYLYPRGRTQSEMETRVYPVSPSMLPVTAEQIAE